VPVQQLDEALTDSAGCAEYANSQFLCHWPLRCLLGFDNFIAFIAAISASGVTK
jgi:hypothetical protein